MEQIKEYTYYLKGMPLATFKINNFKLTGDIHPPWDLYIFGTPNNLILELDPNHNSNKIGMETISDIKKHFFGDDTFKVT